MAEITITEKNFADEVLKSDIPVLVDFWATWCGPCMMLAPVVKEFAEENEGRIKVGKVNVDEEQGLAMMFRVDTIPRLVAFKDGKQINARSGYCAKKDLEELFN